MLEKERNLFTSIDANVGGEKLSPDLMEGFELEFNKFKENFNLDSVENMKQIQDMIKLLTVSENNLEEIKEQKWFQRIWSTISGKNKKLEQINKINLFKVQKGSLYFLQNLANLSPLLMQSINFTLKRVDDIQIQNVKMKKYLLDIIGKYNDKFEGIESRLMNHEFRIRKNENKNLLSNRFLFAGLFIIASISISIIFEKSWFIWFISIISLIIGLYFIILSKDRVDKENVKSDDFDYDIRSYNEKIIPVLKNNIIDVMFDIIDNNYLTYPIDTICENWIKLVELIEPFSTEEKYESKKVAEIIFHSLNLLPDKHQEIIANCSKTSEEIVNFVNITMKNIIQEYLQSSFELDLKTEIDYYKKNEIKDQLLSFNSSNFDKLKRMDSLRLELLSDYPKYKKIILKSDWISFGEGAAGGFISGALFGILGVAVVTILSIIFGKKEEKFIEDFSDRYDNYITEWEELIDNITNSIYPKMQRYSNLVLSDLCNSLDIIFDEFTKQNIKLENLHEEILLIKKEQEDS
jgi:hypothetical protein